MKASRISRVVKLLTTLQAAQKYTANDLAAMFGTSRRTVFRDLKELQAIGVPYHYDSKTGGYRIDPEFFLPPLDLNLQEALSLLLLVQKASGYIQVPFKNSSLMAGLKIENNLPVKIRQYCNIALENISAKAAAQAPTNLLDKMFSELQRAVTKRQVVHIRYHSLFEGNVIEVDLRPYHLMYHHRAWYVLGYSSMHKSVRTFKLNRIRELSITKKFFAKDRRFNLSDYLGRAWSMIPEGRIYNIKLRFLPMVAHNVSEVHWHSTQKVLWQNDGSVVLEFRVDGLREISWWILGYGNQVQVLAPKCLREKVVGMAKELIALHEDL